MIPLIYFDNTLVRDLIATPHLWNDAYDRLTEEFGTEEIRPIDSYYLFFEYIGFTKSHLSLPSNNNLKFDNIGKDREPAEKAAEKIRLILNQSFDKATDDIKIRLASSEIKNLIDQKIMARKQMSSSFTPSSELESILFGYIFDLVANDYENFIDEAALHLAWDYFCCLPASGIATERLREVQLDFWVQLLQETRFLMPFGKIIDDLVPYDIQKRVRFGGKDDMVDSEGLTYATVGLFDAPVNFLTYDDELILKERLKIGQERLDLLEKAPDKKISHCRGSIYHCTKEPFSLKKVKLDFF